VIVYALVVFFVLEYVRPGTYFPPINWLRLNTVVPLIVVLASLFGRAVPPKPSVAAELNAKILIFLLGLVVVTGVFAEFTLYAFDVFTAVLGYCLIFWVLSREIMTVQHLKAVFWVLMFVHLLLAVLTPQMFLDPSVRHYLPAATFMGDGNDYALSIDIVVPLVLFLLLESKRTLEKMALAVALGVLLFAVVATQSRGGTIALGVVGVYYWLKSDKKLVTGALAAVALVGVLALAPGKYFERMSSISQYETDGSAQGRISAWTAGTRMALFNPLGVGAGQFPPNYARYATAGEVGWKTAHSIYFLILGELGFLGLGTLLFFIGSNLEANRRVLKRLKDIDTPEAATGRRIVAALSASLLSYAVAGAFLSATYYPHMFVLAGLLVAARRIASNQGMQTASKASPATPSLVYHPAIRAALSSGKAS
jgi:putative inorganic carbon (hco3(-)) transporter